MLPRKIAKAPKRSSRWRSQAHLSFIRSHHCSIEGCNGMPIEAAHVRMGSGAGMGQKPHDWQAVSLCKECHTRQHTIGEATFWAGTPSGPYDLIEAFCKASPRAAEIRVARAGVAMGILTDG